MRESGGALLFSMCVAAKVSPAHSQPDYAVDSLCTQSLLDCSGAIKALLACDDRIWDELGAPLAERPLHTIIAGWEQLRFRAANAATPPALPSEQSMKAARAIIDYIALPDSQEPADSDGSPTGYIAKIIERHCFPAAVPVGQKQFIGAFRDTAIKCHIGFKHDGPWEKCEWIECEDRRNMIAADTPSPTSETPVGGEAMPRLPFICAKCNVQQHADGICANCGADTLRTQPTVAPVVATGDNEGDEIFDYACNANPRCGWVSTPQSRPLSRGIKVGCPNCNGEARFVGAS